MPSILLCAETEAVRQPTLLGLSGESLDTQSWLCVHTQAEQARAALQNGAGFEELWIEGTDDMDAVNLAAALKRDAPATMVYLIAFDATGSLHSRARAAGIDEVIDRDAFVRMYCARKQRLDTTQVMDATRIAAADVHAGQRAVAFKAPVLDDGTSDRAEFSAVDGEAPASFSATAKKPAAFASASAADTYRMVDVRPAPDGSKRGAFLMTVVGAGGGVGTSTVTALSACMAQKRGLRTLVIDADLQFGDMHFVLGVQNPLRLDDVLVAPRRLQTLDASAGQPALLAAPARLEQSESIEGVLGSIVDQVRTRFDVVMVNTGTLWGDTHMQLLEQSDTTLFVIDQRPSSIRACRHELELCARCGVAAQPFAFALNHCSRKALFSSIDVSCALQGVSVHELQDGGREVEEVLGAGQPIDLVESRNALCASLESLLDTLLPTAMNGVNMPEQAPSRRRTRLPLRRKKVACL